MKMPDFCIQTLICENCGSNISFSIVKNYIRNKMNSRLFKGTLKLERTLLKFHLFFIINVSLKFMLSSGQLQSSNLHSVAEATFTLFLPRNKPLFILM